MAGLSENASAGPHAHTYAWHACTYAQTNGHVKNIMPAAAYRIIYYLFRKRCSRCKLQLYDCIIIHFME